MANQKRKPAQVKNLVNVVFLKLGGTWDMVRRSGKLIGSGNFDDDTLYQLEESLGFYKKGNNNIAPLELKLAKAVEKRIQANSKVTVNLYDHLSWISNIDKHVSGKFITVFDGDSSHLRAGLIAPIVAFILKYANDNPSIQILAGQGTDTADINILSLLDAYLFDTGILPIITSGSNRSRTEWNSDAPKNFSDLVQLAGVNLPSGSYWSFAGHLYRASDFIKIDPLETRRIENYSTFFAPRLTSRHARKLISENNIFHSQSGETTSGNHPLGKTTTENLYRSLTSIDILDLGDQNNIEEEITKILEKKKKAIIVVAHSLGNANNPIRHACIEAALRGKNVIIVSRTLIGEVNERYAASLLGANGKELLGSGKILLSGYRMNKNVAKAIVTRAIQENLRQKKTQELINRYCESRGLLS